MSLPLHIGFIMDGNGRWAQSKGFPRKMGHEAGAKALEKIIDHCRTIGIQCATFYAFSTENWSRPKEEVDALMSLLDRYIAELHRKISSGEADVYKDVQIRFVGDLSVFSEERYFRIRELEKLTDKPYSRLTINIAINYGGRSEIVSAVNRFIAENPGRPLTEKDISLRLYTEGCSDPDLIIRTAGEMRLSNFLIWQSAYSEYYSSPVFWPDFTPKELDIALEAFSKRTRKFGNVAK